MKITKQNYEQFLIDFMDGKMEPSMEESLFEFLDENPEIKAEFDDLEIINTAVDEEISFDFKTELKKRQITSIKNIHERNYEDYFIASTEGDLTITEEMELEEFMAFNPSLTKEYLLYKKSKVQPDLSIHYPHKKTLKKYPFYLQKTWYSSVSVAASIILLLSIFFFTKSDDRIKQTQSAQLKERISIPEKMIYISQRNYIITSTEPITPNLKVIAIPVFPNMADFMIPEEKIQKLKSSLNTKEQLAALQPKFQPTRYILQREMNFNFIPIENTDQVKEDGKSKNAVKAIWKSLFAKNKNSETNGGSENKKSEKVSTLWVLANIGLERVNEVTGTNMRLNSKAIKDGRLSNDEKSNLEISRTAN